MGRVAPCSTKVWDIVATWSDKTAYISPDNVVDSGDMAFRIYDAGYLQFGLTPTNTEPYYGDTVGGRNLQASIGTSAAPVADHQPIIYAEKWSSTNNDGNGAWDAGAGLFVARKRSGSAFVAALTGYSALEGGSNDIVAIHGRAQNRVTSGGNIYAGWFYAHQMSGTGNHTHGIEIDMNTISDTNHKTAYGPGLSVGLFVVTGVDGGKAGTWGIGLHSKDGINKWHTGLVILQNSIVPTSGGVNEAIRIQGGSSLANRYQGIVMTNYIENGLDMSSAVINSYPIHLGASHGIYWGTYVAGSLGGQLYMGSDGNLYWWNARTSTGTKIT